MMGCCPPVAAMKRSGIEGFCGVPENPRIPLHFIRATLAFLRSHKNHVEHLGDLYAFSCETFTFPSHSNRSG